MKRPAAIVVFLTACAPGDPVGQIDAMKPSSLDVDVAAGEKLRFRVACEVDMNGLENAPGGPRGFKAVDALDRSQLSITVGAPKGETIVRCPLKGSGDIQSKSGSKLGRTGLRVDCEVPIAETGKHRITANVAWDPAIKPLSANVEVRRVKN
jgi:hypothetical protein